MAFKCSCCAEKLALERGSRDAAVRPWYIDDHGVKHICVACLKCGTLHDTVGSLVGLLNPFGSALKVTRSMTPLEIGMHITSLTDAQNVRSVAKKLIPDDIIDALLAKNLLGPAYRRA